MIRFLRSPSVTRVPARSKVLIIKVDRMVMYPSDEKDHLIIIWLFVHELVMAYMTNMIANWSIDDCLMIPYNLGEFMLSKAW